MLRSSKYLTLRGKKPWLWLPANNASQTSGADDGNGRSPTLWLDPYRSRLQIAKHSSDEVLIHIVIRVMRQRNPDSRLGWILGSSAHHSFSIDRENESRRGDHVGER
jgi:hypothetical protein